MALFHTNNRFSYLLRKLKVLVSTFFHNDLLLAVYNIYRVFHLRQHLWITPKLMIKKNGLH